MRGDAGRWVFLGRSQHGHSNYLLSFRMLFLHATLRYKNVFYILARRVRGIIEIERQFCHSNECATVREPVRKGGRNFNITAAREIYEEANRNYNYVVISLQGYVPLNSLHYYWLLSFFLLLLRPWRNGAWTGSGTRLHSKWLSNVNHRAISCLRQPTLLLFLKFLNPPRCLNILYFILSWSFYPVTIFRQLSCLLLHFLPPTSRDRNDFASRGRESVRYERP